MSEQPGLLGEQHPRAEAGHRDRRPEAVRPQCTKWSFAPSPMELLGIATMDLPTRSTLWILPSS